MSPAPSRASPIRQLLLEATAVDGAASGERPGAPGGRGRPRFENHQLPTPRQLRAVKALGKRSKDSIREMYDVIMERLSYPSSHVRVCALEIYETLFARSSVFRRLGCDRLDAMVARTILGKLPSPAAYAEELQHRALGLIRRWNREFGAVQPKLGLACRYLDSLGMFADLPEVDDNRPASGNTRHGSMAGEISGGGTDGERVRDDGGRRQGDGTSNVSPAMERAVEEFQSSVSQWRILVTELENARVVLESSRRSHGNQGWTDHVVEDGDGDGEMWEEVGEEGDLTDDVYVPLLESYREASSETIPKLQRIIGACREMYTSGFDARVSGVLQEAVELNAALVTACSAYEKRLGDTVRQAQEKKKQSEKPSGAGGSGAGDELTSREKASQKRHHPSPMPSINPMKLIRDPTMPRERPRPRKARPDGIPDASTDNARDRNKDSVLKKLAAVAPVVPASGFAGVWDSNAPTTAVLGQTMEVANHWGPVDVTKELPKDRLDALFLIDQTKIKYGTDHAGGGQTRSTDLNASAGTSSRREPSRPQSTSEPDTLVTALASSRLKDRNEERCFNEEVLRRANAATEFGFISRPSEHGLGANSDPSQRQNKRKLRVKESLTKKLKLK